MNKKEVAIQIFTGGYNKTEASYEEIENKLKPILEKISIKKVIMGWSIDKELYIKTEKLLHSYGIEFYLWIPVFSETEILNPVKNLIDYKGNTALKYSLHEGENFSFYCPNDIQNTTSFLSVYNEYFKEINFDGVFLDKIRYASFSNGLSSIFSCFCNKCIKKLNEKGIDKELLFNEMKKVELGKDEYSKYPLGIIAYENGKYTFNNPIWKEFFDVKCESINSSIKNIIDFFHFRGLKVGIDTFSPFVSYFAGQDTIKLASMADFIKPMMYRKTQAPAGMIFEFKEMVSKTIHQNIDEAERNFYKILNCKPACNNTFDLDFVKNELLAITKSNACVYAGTEFNYIKRVAEINPEYIKETIYGLSDTDILGYVFSWNLLSAPKENIEQMTACFINRG